MSGSRIQSHWPCSTLCPTSMFSMILATESMPTPATHMTGFLAKTRLARPASSRVRWARIPVDVAASLPRVGEDRVLDLVELAAELGHLLVGEVACGLGRTTGWPSVSNMKRRGGARPGWWSCRARSAVAVMGSPSGVRTDGESCRSVSWWGAVRREA